MPQDKANSHIAYSYTQITDDLGQLQYIPFMTCNETGRPLELYFGVEDGKSLLLPRMSVLY